MSGPLSSGAPATRRDVLLDAGVEVAAFVDVDERKIGKRISGIPVLSHREGDDFIAVA